MLSHSKLTLQPAADAALNQHSPYLAVEVIAGTAREGKPSCSPQLWSRPFLCTVLQLGGLAHKCTKCIQGSSCRVLKTIAGVARRVEEHPFQL